MKNEDNAHFSFCTLHFAFFISLLLFLSGCAAANQSPAPWPQNPSPMVESARAHRRLERIEHPGERFPIESLLPKPVEVFIPSKFAEVTRARLLIHFMGASYIPIHAAANSTTPTVLAAIHLGAGSGINEKPFRDDPALFSRIVAEIRTRVLPMQLDAIDLSAFSAGYGAVRAILSSEAGSIRGVLLLDGLHTSYVPEGKVLHEGGRLDGTRLDLFLRFARRAVAGEKKLIITHSEIFPGTFASTTECADYLIEQLGLRRAAVLNWGPGGMQQISEVRSGMFLVLGFAGNSAPDHLDHFHGMTEFLELLD